jgi:hypothetical protein
MRKEDATDAAVVQLKLIKSQSQDGALHVAQFIKNFESFHWKRFKLPPSEPENLQDYSDFPVPSDSSALNLNVHFTYRCGSNFRGALHTEEELMTLSIRVNFQVLDEGLSGVEALMDADVPGFRIHETFCVFSRWGKSKAEREIVVDPNFPGK